MYYDHLLYSLHSFISYNRISIFLEIMVKCTLMCDRLAHLRGIDVERSLSSLGILYFCDVTFREKIPFIKRSYQGMIFVCLTVSCLIRYPLF